MSHKKICRLCLKYDMNMVNIFAANAQNIQLNKLIEKISDTPVNVDDSLPKCICLNCRKFLFGLNHFIGVCQQSYNTLLTVHLNDEESRVFNTATETQKELRSPIEKMTESKTENNCNPEPKTKRLTSNQAEISSTNKPDQNLSRKCDKSAPVIITKITQSSTQESADSKQILRRVPRKQTFVEIKPNPPKFAKEDSKVVKSIREIPILPNLQKQFTKITEEPISNSSNKDIVVIKSPHSTVVHSNSSNSIKKSVVIAPSTSKVGNNQALTNAQVYNNLSQNSAIQLKPINKTLKFLAVMKSSSEGSKVAVNAQQQMQNPIPYIHSNNSAPSFGSSAESNCQPLILSDPNILQKDSNLASSSSSSSFVVKSKPTVPIVTPLTKRYRDILPKQPIKEPDLQLQLLLNNNEQILGAFPVIKRVCTVPAGVSKHSVKYINVQTVNTDQAEMANIKKEVMEEDPLKIPEVHNMEVSIKEEPKFYETFIKEEFIIPEDSDAETKKRKVKKHQPKRRKQSEEENVKPKKYNLRNKSEQNYECDYCKNKFNYKQALLLHFYGKALRLRRKLNCKLCGDTFDNLCLRKKHEMAAHQVLKNYKCPLCAKQFRKKTDIHQHLIAHLKQCANDRNNSNVRDVVRKYMEGVFHVSKKNGEPQKMAPLLQFSE